MSLLLSVLAAAVCACTGTVPDVRDGAAADAAVQYELIYSQSTPRLVQVRATFTLSDSTLAMVPYGAEHLPDGCLIFDNDETFHGRADAINGTNVWWVGRDSNPEPTT